MSNIIASSSQTQSSLPVQEPMPPMEVEGGKKNIRPNLSTSEVFDRIRSLMCSINSGIGESSGFLLDNNGTVLTVAHNIPNELGPSGKRTFKADSVQVIYDDANTPLFPKLNDTLVSEHARVLDLYCLVTGIQPAKLATIPMLPDTFQLKEGMKVYFAGYPLGQESITFHKGLISSISTDQGITRFTIDGTVVPGNSGGPVVIQHEGNLYLAGVITSEVADFSPEDKKIIAIMKALKEQKSNSPKSTGYAQIGNTTFSGDGPSTTVRLRTSHGIEEIVVKNRDTIFLALDLIQRNLSTGIGKAIDVRHVQHLFQKTPQLEEKDEYDFLVGKGKKLIADTITTELENKKTELLKYIEVRYGQGKGNRGIKITLCPALGTESYIYKFSPNPHTSKGNYNKNQNELYFEAAKFLAQKIYTTKTTPGNFTFNACQSQYTATLQS